MSPLFTLNYGKLLFSTYAKDKSYVFASYNVDRMKQIQGILNNGYALNRTWTKQITNVYMFAEDHIQIDLKDNHHCTLNEDVQSLEVTYFDTENQTDLLFLYQLTELMNTHLYIVNEYEYKPEIPLLSLVGFFVEYNPEQKAFDIDRADYLNAILQIPE